MAEYTFYDPATGRVMQGGVCADDDLFMQHWPGAVRLSGAAGVPDLHYVDLSGAVPVLRERPLLDWPAILTLTVGAAPELALSNDGTVTVGGAVTALSAGPCRLLAAWAGTYDLVVEAWPCRAHRLRVEVTGGGDPPDTAPNSIRLSKSRADIAAHRKRLYQTAWPLPQQMEAHADAAAGNTAKRDRLLADLAAIKAANPYPPESEGP